MDKSEIVEQARELGTLEISNLPDEDCCQLFASRLAETRADVRQLRRLERLVDAGDLVEELVASARPVLPGEEPAAAGPPPAAVTAGV
jgi:thiamine biosynthesis protein ThiI